MSQHTRAARAALSRRVKNELVELLFETTPSIPKRPHPHHPSTTGRTSSLSHAKQTAAATTTTATTSSSYSYKELRKAYLQKLQQIHPDKVGGASSKQGTTTVAAADAAASASSASTQVGTTTAAAANAAAAADAAASSSSHAPHVDLNLNVNDAKLKFQQLQSVWEQYEELVKDMQRVGRKRGNKRNTSTKNLNRYHEADDGGGDEYYEYDDDVIGNSVGEMADFTQFGVGCSFSDSEQERQLRWEITDQACRGWFSSGLIPEQTISEATMMDEDDSADARNIRQQSPISLIDDDMFSIVVVDDDDIATETATATADTTAHFEQDFRRRSKNDSNQPQHQQRQHQHQPQPQRQRRKTLIPGIS